MSRAFAAVAGLLLLVGVASGAGGGPVDAAPAGSHTGTLALLNDTTTDGDLVDGTDDLLATVENTSENLTDETGDVVDAVNNTTDATGDAVDESVENLTTVTGDANVTVGGGGNDSSTPTSTAESPTSTSTRTPTTDADNGTSDATSTPETTDGDATGADGDSSGFPRPVNGETAAGAAVGTGVVAAAAATRAFASGSAEGGAAAANSLTHAFSAALDRLRDRARYVLAAVGYSRWDDSDPLEHDARAALYREIRESPGVHLSAVSDRAGVPLSTARHHLRVLEDENLVTTSKVRGKQRYAPAAETDLPLQAALADDATSAVLRTLAANGPATVSELAAALDRDASTITHHLDRLAEDGLVDRERRGRAVENRLASDVEDAIAVYRNVNALDASDD